MLRVFLTNIGCKLNQAEVESLARSFLAAGHEVVGSVAEADVHVVNSCTVTAQAARDSRKAVRRGRRANPDVRTILTGCHASYRPEESARLAEVDLVVVNEAKESLVAAVEAAFPAPLSPPLPASPAVGRTRATVKVQDGCAMRCAFCVIPLVRGGSRSRSAEDVVAEVATLAAEGFKEVVLTGVQISSWRDADLRLADLVQRVLGVLGDARLRLSSIAPWELDDSLLQAFSDRRLCRHVHMSLQSGCSATLARMRRPHTAADYAARVRSLRSAIEDVAVTTDVIVGFPGETDAEFGDSLSFVRAMKFARVHVFPFSPRPGTVAADLDGRVDEATRKTRVRDMLAVARDAESRALHRSVGAIAEVLWEERHSGSWFGVTDTYLRVRSDDPSDLSNTITAVRITGVEDGTLTGFVAGRR